MRLQPRTITKQRRQRTGIVPPKISSKQEIVQKTILLDRLKILVPNDIAEAIVNAKYTTSDGTEIKIFDVTDIRKDIEPITSNRVDLTEILGTYQFYIDKYGEEEGNEEFLTHIRKIEIAQQKKSEKDILVPHDTVFDSPYLEDFKRQEILKTKLEGRRRIPVKGIVCVKGGCPSKSSYQEKLFVRSGDEPPVEFLECSLCGHKWSRG